MNQRITHFVFGALFGMASSMSTAWADSTPLVQTPLFVTSSVPPLNMLVMGRDHKLYYEAYNDASDLDGDGVIDVGYKPQIDYYGYFNSNVCYDYTGDKGAANKQAAASGRFIPKSKATGDNGKQCSGLWSGNFLNYLTTSRMDAMRRVLYGGQRTEDTTTRTVLEAAYIPRDGHAWGKSYDPQRDTYDINHYAPSLGSPDNKKRHLFAVTTMGVEASNRTQLRVLKNTDWQVWDWVSRESTNGQGGQKCGSASQTASNGKTGVHDCGATIGYNVRVEACTGIAENLRDENCKVYPNKNNQPIYKPTGLLHDFGESEDMYFGLLTGSYQKNIAGGTLRRNISSFIEEVNPQTGVFTDVDGIVTNINRLKVIDFNNSNYYTGCNWDSAYKANPIDYSGGNSADCAMWGNPVAEMMFETLRYFAGADKAHTEYDYGSGTSKDKTHNLAKPTWEPPYTAKSNGGGGYQRCARPVMTVLSDINPSYDYKLPGSRYQSIAADASALSGFNVSTEVDAIGTSEGIHGNDYFIGQSASGNADDAPTPKTINALSWARGLAPEEPSKRGTYYSAGVARYGAMNKIAGTSAGKNEIMTYAVALASPLPQIRIPVGNGHVTVVPFAKSVKSSTNPAIDINKFVPTNPVVDYYVDSIANTGDANRDTSTNDGRPYAKFIINYEDMEVGSDHDMDAIAEYTVALQANGQVKVDVATTFKAGSTVQHMGYVISGTTKDGIYIEIQDRNKNDAFYPLNTPKNKEPGWCIGRSNDDSCKKLELTASRTFDYSPSSSNGEFLKDPLWYAAKYGMPKGATTDVNGDPDNYFLVTNALTLKDQLTSAFNDIMQRNSSVTSPTISTEGSSTADGTFAYTTSFDVDPWSGTLKKVNTRTPGEGSGEWTTDTTMTSAGRNIRFARNGTLASFNWSNLSEAQQALLNTAPNGTTDTLGESRVDFIRGSKLGDIINSTPLLVAGANYSISNANILEGSDNYAAYRNGQAGHSTIYVGANDGMLHAFDAVTGSERFAFIPSAVIKNLPILTAEDYGQEGGTPHRYFVDGSPVARDVYFNGQWHKVLLGSLGAGGRSVFALDVTDPDSPELLWEFSNEDDSDMGYSAPTPGIFRLHTGDWAALVPNGYDSGGNAAVLFVLNIETGEVIKKLTATPVLEEGESGDSLANGLSRLMGFDINNDGIVDYAYAGDLLGNLWRFDLIDTGADNPFTDDATADDLKVSFGGAPLYVARNEDDERQPITAAPLLTRHPSGLGYIVTFGTGRYLTVLDKSNTDQQSLYGIWDRKTAGEATSSSLSDGKGRSSLVEQVFTETTFNGMTTYSLSRNAVDWYDDKGGTADGNVDKWGWYIDFPENGERLVYNMRMLGNTQLLTTITPSEDPCEAGLTGTAYGINSTTGGATLYSTFDLDGDGTYDEGFSGFVYDGGDFSISSGSIYVNEGDGPSGVEDYAVNAGLTEGRQTWRQLPTKE
ncbi:pilus assembly protein [Stutzerimonas nitrititolerans]|uniref:pilus assembly protein n=1 Tax=Stutzerimonas nitrititolerans TaxID=2482751 RepID=UPI0028A66196|nr:PilC/PilY family type IV pilus protein [Stutzerimonas nitrititolerans]